MTNYRNYKYLRPALMAWFVAFMAMFAMVMPANAQKAISAPNKKTITSGTTGTATSKTVTGSRTGTSTNKSRTTRRTTPRRTTTTPAYTDSVTDVDDGWDDATLQNGFEIFGKPYDDYTDNAASQETVRKAIDASTNAKTGCLTNKCAVAIFGVNGYNSNGLPVDMRNALSACNKAKQTINDVAVTDVGWWCVVYDNYHYKGNVPSGMREQLSNYASRHEEILSISISENGDFAIVGDKNYYASNNIDGKVIKNATELYGRINSVCISNRGTLVTCTKGIFYVNVPSNVIDRLKKQNFTPTVIRYTDSGTFIALDGKGGKAFYM